MQQLYNFLEGVDNDRTNLKSLFESSALEKQDLHGQIVEQLFMQRVKDGKHKVLPFWINQIAIQLLVTGARPPDFPDDTATQAKALSHNVAINELPCESRIEKFRGKLWIDSECIAATRIGNSDEFIQERADDAPRRQIAMNSL